MKEKEKRTLEEIKSKNDVPVRLTNERWTHITTSHTDMNDNKDLLLKTVKIPI